MGGIASYVRSVGACALLLAAVSAVCPKTSAKHAVNIVGALIMAVVLISPLRSFDFKDLTAQSSSLEGDILEMSERLGAENASLREKIIEEQTAAYILQRANDFGIVCEVWVTCRDGVPSVATVAADEKDVEKLSEIIRSECGISKIEVRE